MDESISIKPSIFSSTRDYKNDSIEKLEEETQTQTQILSSIKGMLGSLKDRVSNRTEEKEKQKVFSDTNRILTEIEKNTSPKEEGSSLVSVLMLALIPIVKTVKTLFKAARLLVNGLPKILGKLSKTFLGRFSKVFSWLGDTKFFKALKLLSKNKLVDFMKPMKIIRRVLSFFGKSGPIFKLISGFGIFSKVLRFLKFVPVVGQFLAVATSIIDGLVGFFKAGEILGKGKNETITIGDRVIAVVASILDGLGGWLLRAIGISIDVKSIAKGVTKIVKPLFNVFDSIKQIFSPDKNNEGTLFGRIFKAVTDFVFLVPRTLFETFSTLFGATGLESSMFGKVFTSMYEYVASLPDKVYNTFSSLFDSENGLFSKVLSYMETDLPVVIEKVSTFFSGMIKKVFSSIGDIFTLVTENGGDLLELAFFPLRKIGKTFVSAIKTVVSTIVDGITGAISRWLSSIKGLGTKLYTMVSSLFSDEPDVKPSSTSTKPRIDKAKNIVEYKSAEMIDDNSRMETFMNWLGKEFAPSLAKMIGAEITFPGKNKSDNIKTKTVVIG